MSQLKVDSITDEAGTGAPNFPNGLTGDGSALTNLPAPPQLTQTQVEDSASTTFGTVSGERLSQAVSANLVLSKFFESAEQTIINGGSLTLAHGLGAVPKLIVPLLICKTADGGYSVNDVVFINPNIHASGQGTSIVPDATNINIRLGSFKDASYRLIRKDTGNNFDITNNRWSFIVRAWA